MWRKEREYSLGALLDHPVLRVVIRSMGMDRRSVELLTESAEDGDKRQPRASDEPIMD